MYPFFSLRPHPAPSSSRDNYTLAASDATGFLGLRFSSGIFAHDPTEDYHKRLCNIITLKMIPKLGSQQPSHLTSSLSRRSEPPCRVWCYHCPLPVLHFPFLTVAAKSMRPPNLFLCVLWVDLGVPPILAACPSPADGGLPKARQPGVAPMVVRRDVPTQDVARVRLYRAAWGDIRVRVRVQPPWLRDRVHTQGIVPTRLAL